MSPTSIISFKLHNIPNEETKHQKSSVLEIKVKGQVQIETKSVCFWITWIYHQTSGRDNFRWWLIYFDDYIFISLTILRNIEHHDFTDTIVKFNKNKWVDSELFLFKLLSDSTGSLQMWKIIVRMFFSWIKFRKYYLTILLYSFANCSLRATIQCVVWIISVLLCYLLHLEYPPYLLNKILLIWHSHHTAFPSYLSSGDLHSYIDMALTWIIYWAFLGGSDSKESACNARNLGLTAGSGRSPGEGNG